MYIPEVPDNSLRERIAAIAAYSRDLNFGDILGWLEECI